MKDTPYAKKSLGQHWLHDTASLAAMCDAANIGPQDTVLEIGPGPGTLTAELVRRAKKVIAVEFDEQLAKNLHQNILRHSHEHPENKPLSAGNDGLISNLEVVHGDILRFDLTALPRGYKVAANIPYYLTSNLLRVLCESSNPFAQAALLVQKEVAERVCAKPGGMSTLSVSVQFYCDASLGQLVPAGLFTPPPKVDSQILKLTYRQAPLFADTDAKQFFRVVKAGFSQRRKTLLNSLSAGLHLDRRQTEELLGRAGIAPATRAQSLGLPEWHAIYLAYAL